MTEKIRMGMVGGGSGLSGGFMAARERTYSNEAEEGTQGAAAAAGAYVLRKPIWKGIKTAGKIAGKALAPLAVPLEAGFVLSDLKAGSSTPEALLDVVMLGGLERQRQKRKTKNHLVHN